MDFKNAEGVFAHANMILKTQRGMKIIGRFGLNLLFP
jgi:hypothetical protein